MAHAGAAGGAAVGYWGEIDAMHQFCESKYAFSPYFAEFWNAVSNIPCFILPGLWCIWRGRRSHYDYRIHICWALEILVGIGSLMFHATMRFKWEMLDEIPMVLLVLGGLFSKDDCCSLTRGWTKHLIHVVAASIAALGMFLYIRGSHYEMFIHMFALLVVLDVAVTVVAAWHPDKHGSYAAWGCILAYIVTIGSGRVFWEIENSMCPHGGGGPLAWFHVLWHALAGAATYYGILADAQTRYCGAGIGVAVDAADGEWPMLRPFLSRWLRGGHLARNGHAESHGGSRKTD